MRQEEFRTWLCGVKGLGASTARSRVSNCATIEKHEGELDVLFAKDGLSLLLGKLIYSTEDQRQNLPPRHAIPINGNIYNGTATLRSAANLYREFCATGQSVNAVSPSATKPQGKTKTIGDWPRWKSPPSETILALAKMITPYIRFLHPDIVQHLVDDNELNRQLWRKKLMEHGVDPEFYLWENSSCAFPGVRRYTGSREIAFYRKQLGAEELHIPDAIRLDDNSFPKHIWSFIFRGKPFQNFGPSEYSLAHLADHKDYKNRRDADFDVIGRVPGKLCGLYSCASNTVFMPTNLLKLTDFNMDVRRLLLNKAQRLYGAFCNLTPPSLRIKQVSVQEWHEDEFEWDNPVGDGASMNGFLAYRAKIIESL